MSFIIFALLATAAVMFFVSMLEAAVKVRHFGDGWAISNRDADLNQDQRVARAHRAKLNTLEALGLFLPALAAAGFSGSIGWLGQLAVIVWLLARVAYPFAYIGGWPMLRSSIWAAAMVAAAVVGLGALI